MLQNTTRCGTNTTATHTTNTTTHNRKQTIWEPHEANDIEFGNKMDNLKNGTYMKDSTAKISR